MLVSSFSKIFKIANLSMKFLFYRLEIEKLFTILDLLNKLYFNKGLNFIASLRVRVCQRSIRMKWMRILRLLSQIRLKGNNTLDMG